MLKNINGCEIALYRNDYRYILPKLDTKVDCIISDIPYNIGYDTWDTDFVLDCALLNSVLKSDGNIILFQGWSTVCETISLCNKYFALRNWIVWDRIKGRGSKYNLVSTREDILWYSKGDNYTYNPQVSNIKKKTGGMGLRNGEENRKLSNVWYDISPIVPWSKERVNHPTQKPIELMERCVRLWSNEGDTVLDFTMGSGSTGIACKNLNRNFIGIEINKQYFELAKTRLFN
jgi:site-specific DNA-methyltransferase (adenine-specific)